jgi:hypothetical protein
LLDHLDVQLLFHIDLTISTATCASTSTSCTSTTTSFRPVAQPSDDRANASGPEGWGGADGHDVGRRAGDGRVFRADERELSEVRATMSVPFDVNEWS